MSETNTDLAVIPEFDTISFLGKIESASSLSQKVRIFNDAINQDPIMPKNLKKEMQKKGLNAGSAQDFDYVAIEVVEEALRQIFFRQVDFIIKNSYRDLNSFVVVATIKYKCPITLEYREIDGIGAVKLQQDAGAKVQDFNMTMKSNALELGVGTAYSRAIKNAAKRLGKLFGANLNRDEELENIIVFNEKVTNKDASNLKELQLLFKDKNKLLSSDNVENFNRIIEKEEKTNYKKAIDFLKKL